MKGLDPRACLKRQDRLREKLADARLDGALICDRRHVHYLSAYWNLAWPVAFFLSVDDKSHLSVPVPPSDEVAADAVTRYELDRLCTLVEDRPAASLGPLKPLIATTKRIGCDVAPGHWRLPDVETANLLPALQSLRRKKDADEIAILRQCITATEACYSLAKRDLEPGLTEIELHARMHAEAVRTAGEPIGRFGNDFQFGSPGGPPRDHPAEEGELAVLDLGVSLRGYTSDLCRSFCVAHKPSDAQLAAHARIVEAMDHVESRVKPGVSASAVFQEVFDSLNANDQGWEFPHHLGHGIGLSPHECPRINPNWDDHFEVGDVITAEPGLYAAELRAGIRLEQNYLVTETGVERLSSFPLDL